MKTKDAKQKEFIEMLKACKALKQNLYSLTTHNQNLLTSLEKGKESLWTTFLDVDKFYALVTVLTDLKTCLDDLIELLKNKLNILTEGLENEINDI
jgi:hypothetical protein